MSLKICQCFLLVVSGVVAFQSFQHSSSLTTRSRSSHHTTRTIQMMSLNHVHQVQKASMLASLAIVLALDSSLYPVYAITSDSSIVVSSATSSSSKSLKDMLREIAPVDTSISEVQPEATPLPTTSSASSPSEPQPTAAATFQLPTIPAMPVPLPVLPLQPTFSLPSMPENLPSGKEMFKTLVSDWRLFAGIASVVLAVDVAKHKDELKHIKDEQEDKIKVLESSLKELEDLNAANVGKLGDMEATATRLHTQVATLEAELKDKFSTISSLEGEVASLKARTSGVSTTVTGDLADSMRRMQKLDAENRALRMQQSKGSAAPVASSVGSAVTSTSGREEETLKAVRSFLLSQGYVGQGVANMLITGTLVSILEECAVKGPPVATVTATTVAPSAPVAPAPVAPTVVVKEVVKEVMVKDYGKVSAEKDLMAKLENSKSLIAKLHDQLATANLAKVKAEEGAAQVPELTAEISKLKAELTASLSKASTVTEAAETKAHLKEKDAELAKLVKEVAKLGKDLAHAEKELSAAKSKVASKPVTAAAATGDMEEYLGQLKSENEELKSRLMTSDERLMEITNEAQKKVDSAKEMAKMLNAQLLQKASEFEKKETQLMGLLSEAKTLVKEESKKGELAAAAAKADLEAAKAQATVVVEEVKSAAVKKGKKATTEDVDAKLKKKKTTTSAADRSVIDPSIAALVDELKGLKPYLLKKKSKKEVDDIATALNLAPNAADRSKADLLTLIENRLLL